MERRQPLFRRALVKGLRQIGERPLLVFAAGEVREHAAAIALAALLAKLELASTTWGFGM